jgi:uncharacterized protein
VPSGPRWLYLHGFASSPESKKGRAIAEHYLERGITMDRLDLRRPSLAHLRVSMMIAHVVECIGGPADRAVVFGSSLGGLTACRVAERDARVCALVLLAPAFGLARAWRARLGDGEWNEWRDRGWLEVHDHATGGIARVDHGFVLELDGMDASDQGMPDVRVPTLIIHGVSDDTVDVERSRTFAAGKRHVKLVEVDDGHELVRSLPRIKTEADAFLAGFLGS